MIYLIFFKEKRETLKLKDGNIDCEKMRIGASCGSMKTIALMTAVALGGIVAMGADTTTTTVSQDATAPGITSQKDGKGAVSCDGSYWINVDTMTLAAANGDPIAQYAIAYITENGINGVSKDPEKAKALYAHALPGLKSAADDGNPTACRALAHMYAHGKGVDKDEDAAREFMQKCKENSEKKDSDNKDADSGM